jgi:hypothetical protein
MMFTTNCGVIDPVISRIRPTPRSRVSQGVDMALGDILNINLPFIRYTTNFLNGK